MLPADVKHLISPPHTSNSSTPSIGHTNGSLEAIDSVLSMLSPSLDEELAANGGGMSKKKKKNTKGWDGEAVVVSGDGSNLPYDHDGMCYVNLMPMMCNSYYPLQIL